MIARNSMQFKAFIKKKAKEKNISAQLVLQNFMLERLLERVSKSDYKNNFIIKGGFLISSIVGLDTRTTMDLDTTIKNISLTSDSIRNIFEIICNININDGIKFEMLNVQDILIDNDYPGIRVLLKARYEQINVPLSVDLTTGDIITPREIEHSFHLSFYDKTINLLAYNLETVIAEKIETVLSRGVANTRIRDYYDIYILYSLYQDQLDSKTLLKAIKRTFDKRGSSLVLDNYFDIVEEIRNSKVLKGFWEKYKKNYSYASNITYNTVCDTIELVMNNIKNSEE